MRNKLSIWQQKALQFRKENDRVPKTRFGYPLDGLLLPNVDYFTICGGRLDEIAQSFGLLRKVMRNIMTGEAQNKSGNFYLEKMWNKLNYYASKGDKKKFDSLCHILLLHSKSMRALMIWRKDTSWYKTKTVSQIESLAMEIDEIIRDPSKTLVARQFKIPKQDGSERTITSPSLAWRVVCHWYYQYLWLWLWATNKTPASNQHGGVKWRGTKSCLLELEKSVIDKKYILEIDLKKFFDRVEWHKLLDVGWKENIPIGIFSWIFKSIVNAPRELSYNLKDVKIGSERWKQRIVKKEDLTPDLFEWYMGQIQVHGFEPSAIAIPYREGFLKSALKEFRNNSLRGINNHEDRENYQELLSLIEPGRVGVPQGHPLSPLLSILTLNDLYKKSEGNLLMYMDDGIIYGDTYEEVINTLQKLIELGEKLSGVSINSLKSSWVKSDGDWLDSLKFLGVRYIPKEGTFYGETRNGSKVEIPRRSLKGAKLPTEYTEKDQYILEDIRGSGREAFRYDFFGTCLSFMYNNGNIDSSSERKIWKLEAKKNSTVSRIQSKYWKQGIKLDLANASSYATKELRNIWENTYKELQIR